MGSRVFLLLVLSIAFALLISSEVAARDLAETTVKTDGFNPLARPSPPAPNGGGNNGGGHHHGGGNGGGGNNGGGGGNHGRKCRDICQGDCC